MDATNEIKGVGRLTIHDGKQEEFKRLASQIMQIVQTNEPGTLQYELYLNAQQTECLVLERYRDVHALVEHHRNVSGLMGALLETCSMGSGEVCATATPELVKAFEGASVRLFSPFQSL